MHDALYTLHDRVVNPHRPRPSTASILTQSAFFLCSSRHMYMRSININKLKGDPCACAPKFKLLDILESREFVMSMSFFNTIKTTKLL